MKKRFYLSVNKLGMLGRSVPVQVVNESEDKLRVRLLEDCLKRSLLGMQCGLELIAKAGEEFEMPNEYGKDLRQYFEVLGEEFAITVNLTDSKGRNGYFGELRYALPIQEQFRLYR